MQVYEKLGAFYLGRLYDLAAAQARPDLLLYDAKDLTTHAVCVGMTGSGKTGLCLALLEEAAIDGIPAIAIDPKGDLGNLLLTFPELRPTDFRDWIDPAEAQRQGCSVDQLAAQTARRWADGLAAWDQDGERIRRFRNAADVAIYTPGSTAGLPLTVLRSLAAPPAAVVHDADAFRERVQSSVSGLLALLGVTADPLRSREHILLSNILDQTWRTGHDLDMGALIRQIQSPPFDKVGFMDLETIFPAADRFELAMRLNNLLASPGFSAWISGEPLSIPRLLHAADGRPRLSVLSIAHLSDAERMFFVTTLLNEVVTWMRTQPGTSSLRALLYMDEVFGYFPPTANPPSKTPMLTLLKQARAYGLGVVLATQNPVDLDYKGLSNAGTWFLGRLQTERDKARVLDGLEGAEATTGTDFERGRMAEILAGLASRVFLMNNVHDDEPVVFQSRWALSYLRGPLTREHIGRLMAGRKAESLQTAAATAQAASAALQPSAIGAESTGDGDATFSAGERPIVPPDVPECFLAVKRPAASGARLVYRPALLGAATLHFASSRAGIDAWRNATLLATTSGENPETLWDDAQRLEYVLQLDSAPNSPATFASLPSPLAAGKNYRRWTSMLKSHLYQQHALEVFHSPLVKEYSQPGEDEGAFRGRLAHCLRERRDLEVERLRKRFAPKLKTLQDRIRRAGQAVDREKSQAREQGFGALISLGQTILGAMFGRKLASRTNVTRAASSMRAAGRATRQRGDVDRAEESVEALQKQLDELEQQFESETSSLQERFRLDSAEIETVSIQPRKSDLTIDRLSLAWAPYFVDAAGIAEPAFG